MVPPSELTCHLDRQWQQMYSSKESERIKRIQDTYNCCGLHSAKDRAWPFPAKDRAVTACSTTFGRSKSCFGRWRRDEQISAGLFLMVALTTFVVKVSKDTSNYKRDMCYGHGRPWLKASLLCSKVFAILFVRPNTSWMYSYQSPTSTGGNDASAPIQHNQARIEGSYHDDEAPKPISRAGSAGHNRALTMEYGRAGGDGHTRVLLPSSQARVQQDGSEWI